MEIASINEINYTDEKMILFECLGGCYTEGEMIELCLEKWVANY